MSGTRRTTTRCSACRRRRRRRRSPRPTASSRASSHPDTHPGDAAAEERFKEISAAYDVLGDDAKRKEYDEVRRLGAAGGVRADGFRPGGDGGMSFNVGADGLGDLLGQMFGRGRRGGGASSASGPQRGADVEARADARLRRRGSRPHHHAVPHHRRAVQHLPAAAGAKPGTSAEGVLALRRSRRHRRQPGLLLAVVAVPGVHRARCGRRGSVPHLLRLRRREAPARGAGAHPRRCRRRAADPAEGSRCRRAATVARPATCSSSATSPRTRCSGATGTTSPCACRSRSPRRRSARVIDVPTLDGTPVTLRLKPGTAVGFAPPRARQGHRQGEVHGRPDRHGRRRGARPTSTTRSAQPSRRSPRRPTCRRGTA